MAQIQAHQGYFQSDGQLIFTNKVVTPPKYKKVTIIWEDEIVETAADPKLTPQQKNTVHQITESLNEINKIPVDQDTQAISDLFDHGAFRVHFPNRLAGSYEETL